MSVWEYHVASLVIASGGFAQWGEFLQSMGKEHWELVNDHVFPSRDGAGTTIVVYGTFKRPAAHA